MKYKKIQPFGRQVEDNIKQSLQIAGIYIESTPELDHNHKIDFIVRIENQHVGVQFSLKKDDIKAKVAKICALDKVSRFIYLNLSDCFFTKPDRDNGIQLYSLLKYIINEYSQKAIWLMVDMKGWQVKSI